MGMNGKSAACLKLIIFVLLVLTVLASLVAVSTNYWFEHGNTDHQGLWYYCNDEDLGCLHFDEYPTISEVPDWHYAVLGLFAFSSFSHLILVIITVGWLCKKKVSKCFYAFSVIFSTISWISLVTAMGIYTRNFYPAIQKDVGYKWGYSFGLGWLSFILHTVALLISIILALKDRNYNNQNYEHPDDMHYEY